MLARMHPTTKPAKHIAAHLETLRRVALSWPATREDHPWGHVAFKVRDKTFCWVVADGEGLSLSVKLPHSGDVALSLPNAEPTGYGLGKSGWVSARFSPKEDVPMPLLIAWLEESYRANAPKKLAAAIGSGTAPAPATRASAKRPVKKKPAPAKKPAKKAAKKRRAPARAR